MTLEFRVYFCSSTIYYKYNLSKSGLRFPKLLSILAFIYFNSSVQYSNPTEVFYTNPAGSLSEL